MAADVAQCERSNIKYYASAFSNILRIEHKRNWDIEIPQLNHPTDINIYIDVRRGRKIERLLLEAKIEVETVEQEDETMSETVEHKLKP